MVMVRNAMTSLSKGRIMACKQKDFVAPCQKQMILRLSALFLNLTLLSALPQWGEAAQIDLIGPAGSGAFGSSIVALPNGNFLVTDPYYSIPSGATNVGAVYLYDGGTLAVVSTLTGSMQNDRVGSYGVRILSNGNFVVVSPTWNNGLAASAGAVTWGSGSTGVSGVVSATNSLVGSQPEDFIGTAIYPLNNGNYVVQSYEWSNGTVTNAGAVTWGSGVSGVTGAVSSANSLVGSSANDAIGGVIPLNNGNYLVRSASWDNGNATNAGAVTWGNGLTGVAGAISAANSLVGSSTDDEVGGNTVVVLPNGNYVVRMPHWDNGIMTNAGAVTWGNGLTGVSGTISGANSLVGTNIYDGVGISLTALSNGNYVVTSTLWSNLLGAVTWCNGTTGRTGAISSANSLVGSQTFDQVGAGGVAALNNGNYVVSSFIWGNSSVGGVGAVTWGSGETGVTGVVSTLNSLVGIQKRDYVGMGGVTPLNNGNYVVVSYEWDNGAVTNVGAVTWCNGAAGTTGVVSAANSLIGTRAYDQVGISGVLALSNGNYVVRSAYWSNGTATNAGAVTWGSGTTGVAGVVSAANSLMGGSPNDFVGKGDAFGGSSGQPGNGGVTALHNGNYVVSSANWDSGTISNAGAVTWGSGTIGVTGTISIANSLVGNRANDRVGYGGAVALNNGNYIVISTDWNNDTITNVGAVTWGSGTTGVKGLVTAANSLIGSQMNDSVGYGGVVPLNNGNYVVLNRLWDNGAATNAGAITLGGGTLGTKGFVTAANSVIGDVADSGGGTRGGHSMRYSMDYANNRLLVGYESSNRVSLFSYAAPTDLDLSAGSVPRNNTVGAMVGTFSTTDSDPGDSAIFTFATGSGDTDNASFSIISSELRTAVGFDQDAKNKHQIRVRATDSSGLTIEKQFEIDVASPPILGVQLQGQTNSIGDTITFEASATGSPPLAYQWCFHGNALANATNSTLRLTNVARTNSGYYSIIVTNAYGSVTSSNALLRVMVPQRILPLTALGGGRYRISFADSDGGLLFNWDSSSLEVQGSTNLSNTNWLTLTNAIVISNGIGQVEFVVTNSTPQQFYRIRMR
jgi:hypothetical protein